MPASNPGGLPQLFRAIYKDDDSGAITPLSKTAIINPRLDGKLNENVVLWSDIKIAFRNAVHVWHENTVVSHLTDENLDFLQPLRILAYPGVILDVVIEYPKINSNIESPTIKDSPIATSTSPSFQSLTGVETTTSSITPPPSTSDNISNSSIKREPEDRGEPLTSSASPIPVSIDRAPQIIPNQNDHSNDFYNHTYLDLEFTSGNTSDFYLETLQEDEEKDMTNAYEQGLSFYQGEVVHRSYSKAIECFLKAARQGHIDALCYMGLMYGMGQGVQQDYSKAIKWYQKAANQGYARAQFHLGTVYYNGYGVILDYSKAVKWYQKAASQGHSDAQFKLGVMYNHGHGVTRDYSKAIDWYQKAAILGDVGAQLNLGKMYEHGEGVTQDPSKADEWYQMAAGQGFI
ncbi:hypothetical protein BGX27_006862 [Mortierella sp. AM989]|nr:hypothetical protein BGX27_006862 [Mortierella sp. AM989]